ncbi:PilZ domain-containing protein [Thalassotalea ganghwensis]
MTKDFSKYQHIIDNFKGKVSAKDFEAKFADATQSLNKTERFLLKMEIKRLASPCTRLVDLRGHVDGECRAYEHEGRVHFLDDVAIKVFEQNVNVYGEYTFGVYEALMNTENNFRVMYQREKANPQNSAELQQNQTQKNKEKTQYPATLYRFGPYFDRKEERMNFAIAIKVVVNDKDVLDATSSDISINGCKFRFSKSQSLQVRQIISIRFIGLEQEFQFKNEDKYEYEVRNIHTVEDVQWVGCRRIYRTDESRDGFNKFLNGYIQGNKRRYKVNLDNTIAALKSRIFEQFTLPKSNELPIFLHEVDGVPTPKYALTCHNNQSIYQYWQDERHTSTLHYLVTPERLARLKRVQKQGKALYVYSFIHRSQGKSYFYTADNVQLSDDKAFMTEYLGFAANKGDFMITQLTLLEVNPDYAESRLTLSNTIAKKDQYLNLPMPDDVKETIEQLTYIVVANELAEPNLFKIYHQLNYENISTAKLKTFGHKRQKQGLIVEDVGVNYNNQRSEPRFYYKTPVILEVGGVTWKGVSEDFSASGLKVELEKSAALSASEVVNVTFPQLQKITASFDLKGLPYEVMHINKKKNVLNLRVHVQKHRHIGRAFFKALIEKNKDKLTRDEYAMMRPELAKALRNIYSRSVAIPSLVIQTSGSRYKIEVITCNSDNVKIIDLCQQLSDRQRFYNLYPLLNNLQATTLMHSTLKRMQSRDLPIVDIIYIAIDDSKEIIEQAVSTKLESEFESEQDKKQFIRDALKLGSFTCIQVKLSRVDKPDIEHLSPELNYISSYAIHRGKQLEQEIWSVAGVAQLLDITEEAMTRFHLIPEKENLSHEVMT